MKQGWQIYKLEDICTIYDKLRKPISKKDRVSGIYPYYGASCVQDYVNDYLFDGRYVLIGEDGAKWGTGEDTAYIVEGKFWVNNHAHIIQCNNGIVDTFIYYYFNHLDLTKLVAGAIIPKLTQETLRSMEIPIPPLSEQQRIVALLDAEFAKIDALKANAEKNLQNAKDLFQAALKKELEPKEGWNKKQLGEIAEFKNGLNFGKEQGCHKYHFLGVGDFKENTIVETDTLSYIYQDCIDPDYYLKDNDIVFVRSNGSRHLVGRSLLIKSGNEPSVFSGFCIRCRFLSSIVLPQFAMRFFSLDTTKRILTSSGGGCNISNLNQKVLSALEIPFPTSIDEQANIVSRIAQMESHCKNLQANYEKTLSLCDDLKQALLRKAFNGEI
jgi:type I restriction enzyme S subunit